MPMLIIILLFEHIIWVLDVKLIIKTAFLWDSIGGGGFPGKKDIGLNTPPLVKKSTP